ncbi:uncharacterized protein LOC126162316 [Schistocerca cancellata]|uniref:uncharacterized protein LOC126162316 n=1 Tax=Schistocerca cancellata TaxID=274614 RepID=UPI002117E7FB|nr:uncharacterized protein LOC126162316 [Schistocerca cancellata]
MCVLQDIKFLGRKIVSQKSVFAYRTVEMEITLMGSREIQCDKRTKFDNLILFNSTASSSSGVRRLLGAPRPRLLTMKVLFLEADLSRKLNFE